MDEIEGYQKIIDGARQVLDNYKPHIVVDPAWPIIRLGDIFKTKSGTTPLRDNSAYFEGGNIPWVKTLDLRDGPLSTTDECVTELALAETHLEKLPKGTVEGLLKCKSCEKVHFSGAKDFAASWTACSPVSGRFSSF